LLADRYLIDTNHLLRMVVIQDDHAAACQHAAAVLRRKRIPVIFTLQNASEFWNTCTRPIQSNGLAMHPTEVAYALEVLLSQFELIPDTIDVFRRWKSLVTTYSVRGVQVHDAKLVASMLPHHIPTILTLNDRDFRRYDGIHAVRPEEITA
jgi:predicted nucleic acid-binding protein